MEKEPESGRDEDEDADKVETESAPATGLKVGDELKAAIAQLTERQMWMENAIKNLYHKCGFRVPS